AGNSPSISSAASGSAVPVACVSRASTTRPLRFSISRWPVKASLASLPLDFLASRASGSVVEAVLAAKTLHRRPRLYKSTVNREMLGRQQPAHFGQIQYGRHEFGCDVA